MIVVLCNAPLRSFVGPLRYLVIPSIDTIEITPRSMQISEHGSLFPLLPRIGKNESGFLKVHTTTCIL